MICQLHGPDENAAQNWNLTKRPQGIQEYENLERCRSPDRHQPKGNHSGKEDCGNETKFLPKAQIPIDRNDE
jgi:hypothetical protein